jgi:oxygen-independent coproporphyrinogen-3 oxidase
MRPLGLYVHIPFCRRKCHYCDFVSFPGSERLIGDYIGAVVAEARLYNDYLKDHSVDTLFIGGGTPSLLSLAQVETLIRGLEEACNFELKEVTIEANPETLGEEKLAAYAACGINRLSIGLQTHDDAILKSIGRRHTFRQFLTAYETAARYFDNINIDTIFGLPGQTLDNFRATIERLTELSPAHISYYSLKLEPGTKLYETYKGADEDTDRDMYHAAASMLDSAGYIHYETSNFAKENKECLHNLKYWTGQEYLGLGVAAHSYINDTNKQRFSNTDSINDYLELISRGDKPVAQAYALSEADELTEYLMLRFRLKRGIVYEDFNEHFGRDFKTMFLQPVQFAANAGLITIDGRGVHPTLKGFDLQNTLITEFMKII